MFAKLVSMAANGIISSRGAKDVLKIMFEQGGDRKKSSKKKVWRKLPTILSSKI